MYFTPHIDLARSVVVGQKYFPFISISIRRVFAVQANNSSSLARRKSKFVANFVETLPLHRDIVQPDFHLENRSTAEKIERERNRNEK